MRFFKYKGFKKIASITWTYTRFFSDKTTYSTQEIIPPPTMSSTLPTVTTPTCLKRRYDEIINPYIGQFLRIGRDHLKLKIVVLVNFLN